MRGRRRIAAIGALLLLLALPAWSVDRVAFLAAWLAAWLFCLAIVLGGLAIVWIHNLTHGLWGEPLRLPLAALGRLLPWLALLFLPILVGVRDLYPWAATAAQGTARWAGELSAPGFKNAWLQPDAFIVRALCLLLLWNLLAWAARRTAWARSGPFAAAALVLYGLSVSVAAVDWVMSLMPVWYSSIFGLELGVGQVLAAMAFAVLAARWPDEARARTGRDWGNLLFAFVLTWAYTAFSQWLVIWSENLPHEIAWYVVRERQPWLALGVLLALVQFAAPLVLLLFRPLKESPARLRRLCGVLLAAHFLELWWLILPSVADRIEGLALVWVLPLTMLGLPALCYGLLPAADREGHREAWHG